MNDTVFYIILILIVVLLFLAYLLIAYFYNSYDTYKIKTNDNFTKTKDYINNTTKTLDTNMTTLNINTNNKYAAIIDNIKNENNIKFNKIDSNLLLVSSNNFKLESNITSNTTNLNNFDRNIKQYIEFKDNNNNINEAIFNHTFGAIPNLSLNIIRNITAISGMTIKTDELNSNQFRICDNDITSTNCIDMSVKNGIFNIYPSDIQNNNVNNLKISAKNKNTLANFDLTNNNIYLGGEGENASLFIDSNNKPYVKELNFLTNNTKYNDVKQVYDITNVPTQTYNTFKYSNNNIIDLYKNNFDNSVPGMYTIFKGTPNTIILNLKFKSSYIDNSSIINITIDELLNTENNITPTIITETIDINTFINSIKLNLNKITITFKSSATMPANNSNIRIKLSSDKFTIPASYTDASISNIFTGVITK
jgi:hypothetical protein